VNQHLLKDLTELGLWDETMKHKLIAYGGSVQVRALAVKTEGEERGGVWEVLHPLCFKNSKGGKIPLSQMKPSGCS